MQKYLNIYSTSNALSISIMSTAVNGVTLYDSNTQLAIPNIIQTIDIIDIPKNLRLISNVTDNVIKIIIELHIKTYGLEIR